MKIGSKLAILVFSIIAIAHLCRLIFAMEMTIGDWILPQWVSVFGVIGPGIIAALLWKESK